MDLVSLLRRFNRTYTQRIGVLDDSYLGTGRTLNVSRVLFEVAQRQIPAPTVLALRERLGLDSGYMSRLLNSLEAEGLIVVAPDPTDRRRRVVTLTEPGRDAVADLDQRSDRLASSLVAPLTSRQRERLATALETADLLIRSATIELREVDLESPETKMALSAYYRELNQRFAGGFDPGPPSSSDQDGRFVAGLTADQVVAYGGIRPLEEQIAEVKRMWVHQDWRGAGLGSRMLRHLEELARSQGCTRIRLDTNGTLSEAIAVYGRAGYREIPRYNDNPYAEHFFEKDL